MSIRARVRSNTWRRRREALIGEWGERTSRRPGTDEELATHVACCGRTPMVARLSAFQFCTRSSNAFQVASFNGANNKQMRFWEQGPIPSCRRPRACSLSGGAQDDSGSSSFRAPRPPRAPPLSWHYLSMATDADAASQDAAKLFKEGFYSEAICAYAAAKSGGPTQIISILATARPRY